MDLSYLDVTVLPGYHVDLVIGKLFLRVDVYDYNVYNDCVHECRMKIGYFLQEFYSLANFIKQIVPIPIYFPTPSGSLKIIFHNHTDHIFHIGLQKVQHLNLLADEIREIFRTKSIILSHLAETYPNYPRNFKSDPGTQRILEEYNTVTASGRFPYKISIARTAKL